MGRVSSHSFVFAALLVTASVAVENGDELCCNRLQQNLENQMKRTQLIEDALRRTLAILGSSLGAEFLGSLEEDPVISSIMSVDQSSSDDVSTPQGEESTEVISDKNSYSHLKGILKCSFGSQLDIRFADESNATQNLVESIEVSYQTEEQSMSVQLALPSVSCKKLITGIWIRIFESGLSVTGQPYLKIPTKCFVFKDNNVSIALPSLKRKSCFFSIPELVQCRSYTVQVIPNYDSFRGRFFETKIVIPPKLDKLYSLGSLMSVFADSTSLKLNWQDDSGCADQMTSIHLQLHPDGNQELSLVTSLQIPRKCLTINEQNLFSVSLSSNHSCDSVTWKPLDPCRKYSLEIKSEYTDTWIGPSSSMQIFTLQRREVNVGNFGKSPNFHHYGNIHFCDKYLSMTIMCNGRNDCHDGRDEKYCGRSECRDGFGCSLQCLPRELVCDGQVDCVDGKDESSCSSFDSLSWCSQQTSPFGIVSPKRLPESVLISVKPNHTIWLSIDSSMQDHIEVYDGPYQTSRRLSIDQKSVLGPKSVRSSSSDLFITYPYWQGRGEVYYTSMENDGTEYVPGCGGYILNQGNIAVPLYPESECVWYIESHNEKHTLLLASKNGNGMLPYSMIVYNGWNATGEMLYNSTETPNSAIFSSSSRLRVQVQDLDRDWDATSVPKRTSTSANVWTVSSVSSECQTHLQEQTGTIMSPNYPSMYSNLSDCRWTIRVEKGFRIRLLFAIFNTELDRDSVHVYDGPSVFSPKILYKSGSIPTPFVISSTSNEMVVRFTTDHETTGHGFLAVYSSVA